MATMSPSNGTALTNSVGVATITLTPANFLSAGGATTISATAQVGSTAVTGSLGYSIGATTVTLDTPTFGTGSGSVAAPGLSAYGTTSVTVNVYSSANQIPANLISTPQIVTFSSACSSSGKAALSTSVTTVNGVATASYRDIGCAGSDLVTATVSGLSVSTSNTIYVAAPSAGSIVYVSSTPSSISLAGSGGDSVSQIAFKVVDGTGMPISGKNVVFNLATAIGGVTLTPPETNPATPVTSDSTGMVYVNVNAGTISAVVRVTASTCSTSFSSLTSPYTCSNSGKLLTSQSSNLAIATGTPAQDSFSASASAHNIEGWSIDGVTTTISVRMSDHFHNPVPDGTSVYFTTEGGSITPICTTTGGECTVVLSSQIPRPSSATNGYGRVTVLARAIGEEAFIDLNSNGLVDNAGEMIDVNLHSTDMGDAFVDFNENGVRDALTEPYFDFNSNGYYTAPAAAVSGDIAHLSDGKYRGTLCASGAAICSTQKSIDVRGGQVIVFSSSDANISSTAISPVPLVSCSNGLTPANTVPTVIASTPTNITVTVVDANGNAMPAGTIVSFSTNNGVSVAPASYTVPDTIGCRTGYAGCPASAGSATFGDIGVSMLSDAVYVPAAGTTPASCQNAIVDGTLFVTVTTPGATTPSGSVAGTISTFSLGLTEQ
ncbi:MAG: hypothetical protein PHQ60_12100 [Sideroxydans sp.]|nr:hypothetical protein [Sideroxydans sp.]